MDKNNTNILIIGASGYIGYELSKFLVNKDYKIRLLLRKKSTKIFNKGILQKIQILYGDYHDVISISKALAGMHIVINLVPSFSLENINDDDSKFLKKAHKADTIFLEACEKANIKKIIYSSSGGAVYGNSQNNSLPFTEDYPVNPISKYGLSKLFFEKSLEDLKKRAGINHTILRISNPYGPGQSPNRNIGVISKFIWSYINGYEVKVYGNASNYRDYIYISDLLCAIENVLLNGFNESHTFNIGSGKKTSLDDLIDNINELSSQKLLIRNISKRQNDVNSNYLNIDLAKKQLNWSPQVSLQTGIIKTYEYFLSKKEDK